MTDEIKGKSIVIQGDIESLDHICTIEQRFNERLIWSSILPQEQFAVMLDQRLEQIKDNIISQLYGEKR